jgi:uncharacterized protein Veg
MREFGYTIQELKETYASTFMILIEEMNKQAEREENEAKKYKTIR